MINLKEEINNFFVSTSIHGLSYTSNIHSRCTRIIWTIIIIAASAMASIFLYQAVQGYDTKFTRTNVEKRSVQEYPFPAVTFHPGEYNYKKYFHRNLLNQIEFTRYKKNSPLRDNDKFLKQFDWIVEPMNEDLFFKLSKFLIVETNFIYEKTKKIFRKEVCPLVAMETMKKSLHHQILNVFKRNMYKYVGYSQVIKTIKNNLSPLIEENVAAYNFTKKDMTAICDDPKQKDIKLSIEALLLSFLYLYINGDNVDVAAGNLVTYSSFSIGLGRNRQIELTNIFNNMTNGSLPVSVLQISRFFVHEDPKYNRRLLSPKQSIKRIAQGIKNAVKHFEIPTEIFQNYHYLWNSYLNFDQENTAQLLYCLHASNCSNPRSYKLGDQDSDESIVQIQEKPADGVIIERSISKPPCSILEIHFLIEPICKLHMLMIANKKPFLKLMKFSKQNPVYIEQDEEYRTVFSSANTSMSSYGYIFRENKVKICICICSFQVNFLSFLSFLWPIFISKVVNYFYS